MMMPKYLSLAALVLLGLSSTLAFTPAGRKIAAVSRHATLGKSLLSTFPSPVLSIPKNRSTVALWESTAAEGGSDKLSLFKKYAARFCNLFPVWTLMTSCLALKRPSTFLAIPSSTFPAQMDYSCSAWEFLSRQKTSYAFFRGPGQYNWHFWGATVSCVMPGLAVLVGKVLRLHQRSAGVGFFKVSNLCTYIGQGDLAFRVLMTTMTTVGAILMTTLMGKLLLGQVVPVNAAAIALSTIQVVLAPILLGMTFNAKFPDMVKKILPFSPIVGVLVTCLLVGVSVAGCATPILTAGFQLQLAAFLLHALGGVTGYMFTKPFYEEDICRTFAIEFAMKSSAFGYLLASLHLSDFAVRVPAAVSIVWMTLIGSCLAVASRFFPPKECMHRAGRRINHQPYLLMFCYCMGNFKYLRLSQRDASPAESP